MYVLKNNGTQQLLKTESTDFLPRCVKLTVEFEEVHGTRPSNERLFRLIAELVDAVDSSEKKLVSDKCAFGNVNFGRLFTIGMREPRDKQATTSFTSKNYKSRLELCQAPSNYYVVVFFFSLELTSTTYTGLAGNLIFISWTIGQVIVTLFAFITLDWQKLKWANTAFIGLGIPYLYFMPESPLYIYAKGQYVSLENILKRIATQNGRKETDWYSYYQEFLRNQPKRLSQTSESTYSQNSYLLLINRTTIIKLILTATIAMMDTSPYLGILFGAIVETISYITSSLLISSRLGRKGSFILMMSLTIICIILIPIIVKYNSIASLGLAQLGKYTISSTTAIAWIFVPELFPTSIRSIANGVFIVFSRLGAITAPIIYTTISKNYLSYTFYVSAVLAFVVLLFSLMLPETKDKPMDDIIDYTTSITDV
ncbi:unnamed protein product [Rotaria sordida]|uniref:Major facilitator superfamily (MFS) profile domain-containing protein n=1 Tax=Rotaria sordida TaxID=392033 RepID=A0A815U338_9BILA|nr:unnamed protein product [Rotaria sordida]CAF1658503.1 unnamed protein product [Rotaria sordida]